MKGRCLEYGDLFPFFLAQINLAVPEWFYPSQVAPSRSGSVELGWEQMTSSPQQCIHYNALFKSGEVLKSDV